MEYKDLQVRYSECYRKVLDHEKCELTIEALKKHLTENKIKLKGLQIRERW